MLNRVKAFIQRFSPESLNVSPVVVTLDSALKACIDSKLSLEMFVELFVTQPYAPAFDLLKQCEFGVDLGANRGFFLLFACHYLRKRGQSQAPRFVCVEAAKSNFSRLKQHIEMNGLGDSVVPVLGAVCGQRSGEVEFYYAPRFHGMAGIVRRRNMMTRKVPVVDLAKHVDAQRIDILKMDIEGAEEGFLQEYVEILGKTQVLIAEFHLKEVDYGHCQAILKERGLLFERRTFQFKDVLCVDLYARPSWEG